MQKKYLLWLNLAAYLPAALLHFLTLVPLLTSPGSDYAAMNACACGCTPATGVRCCCNCAAGEKKEEPTGIDETAGAGKELILSRTGCLPGQEGWIPPAPVQDHLEGSDLPLFTVLELSSAQEEARQAPRGAPPENPDKVPI